MGCLFSPDMTDAAHYAAADRTPHVIIQQKNTSPRANPLTCHSNILLESGEKKQKKKLAENALSVHQPILRVAGDGLAGIPKHNIMSGRPRRLSMLR